MRKSNRSSLGVVLIARRRIQQKNDREGRPILCISTTNILLKGMKWRQEFGSPFFPSRVNLPPLRHPVNLPPVALPLPRVAPTHATQSTEEEPPPPHTHPSCCAAAPIPARTRVHLSPSRPPPRMPAPHRVCPAPPPRQPAARLLACPPGAGAARPAAAHLLFFPSPNEVVATSPVNFGPPPSIA
jgi:hypothetical protein